METNLTLDRSIRALPNDERGASESLVHVVRLWARTQPERAAYTYLADGEPITISYGELDRRANALAAQLVTQGWRGATALLAFPTGIDFVEAFYACLYAGVVAVPVPFARGKSGRARLAAIARDCGARAWLTTSACASSTRGDDLTDVALMLTDEVSAAHAAPVDPTGPAASSTAFLQYTSGSTAQPKGTMVSHGNIMANQVMLQQTFGTGGSSVIVSWLPLFHDMGLIGNMLHAAYLGVHAVLLSPLSFMRRPINWLRAIDRYRATFSGAPNFAYDLCVSGTTVSEREGLDLSSWQIAFNGSEPVRHTTLRRFNETFAPHGLRASALTPAYGLAEATLVVSGSGARVATIVQVDSQRLEAGQAAPAPATEPARSVVGCGQFARGDQHVEIVDPESLQRCTAGTIGEIWISGSHVAQGYHGNPAATEQTFRATLRGDRRWYLRTGDLGFVHGDELFVTGRLKDLLIVRGRKLHPQDIELTVEEASAAIRRGSVAAVGVERAEEQRLAVIAEVEHRSLAAPKLAEELAIRIRQEHELPVHQVMLVGRNTLPKTTSGKLQRQRCRQDYGAGRYVPLASWVDPADEAAGATARARSHACRWVGSQRRLDPDLLDPHAPLSSFGIDSIAKVELVRSLEQAFGVTVPEATFHAALSIQDLAVAVSELEPVSSGAARSGQPSPEDPTLAAGLLPRGSSSPTTRPGESRLVLPTFNPLSWSGRK